MLDQHLHFNYKDIFLAPRLALSPKKIWIFTLGNLSGYIFYWVFSFIALIISGINISDALYDFGLYPFLSGNGYSYASWVIYYFGILFWFFSLLLSSSAVSTLTIKQLKGDNFYSVNDAIDDTMKSWKTILFSPITFLIIILSLILIGSVFGLLGKIPFIGSILTSLLFPIYFLGSIFLVFSILVFFSSFLILPALTGAHSQDTIGSVFHSYQILFNQPWRLITYNFLLLPIIVFSMNIFSWFYESSFNLINIILEEVIGKSYSNIISYASSLLNVDFIINNNNIFQILTSNLENLSLELLDFLFLFFEQLLNIFLTILPSLIYNSNGGYISSTETFSAVILSVSLIFLYLSFFSYGFSILSVGQTIIFIIFKKLMEDENLLKSSHDNNDKTIEIDSSTITDSSAKILGLSSEEE